MGKGQQWLFYKILFTPNLSNHCLVSKVEYFEAEFGELKIVFVRRGESSFPLAAWIPGLVGASHLHTSLGDLGAWWSEKYKEKEINENIKKSIC